MFVNKRARQLSGGWKLGITGIDTIENPASEIYKKQVKELALLKQK